MRQPLAQARGHQLAETRKSLGPGQKQIAAAMGVWLNDGLDGLDGRSAIAVTPPSGTFPWVRCG